MTTPTTPPTLTAEDLLSGAGISHTVMLPAEFTPDRLNLNGGGPAQIRLRPLTVKDLQVITRASRDDPSLTAALMVQQAVVEPSLSAAQVAALPAGLARFMLDEINRVSGLSLSADELTEHVQAPLARACFVLSREFGWTPEEVSSLTIGQILLYLEMARPGANGV
jgi:hypothetical protein